MLKKICDAIKPEKSLRKKLILLLYLIPSFILISWLLTFFIGIPLVKYQHDKQIELFYDKIKAQYEKSPKRFRGKIKDLPGPGGYFWRRVFNKINRFPSLEEFKHEDKRDGSATYFSSFPFCIKSRRKGGC